MGKYRAQKADHRPATDEGGSRWRSRLPEGRGPAAMLIVEGGDRALILLPFSRTERAFNDAEQQTVTATLQRLNDLGRIGLLPTSGAWWLNAAGPVPAKVDGAWVASRLRDQAPVRIRLPT